MEVYSASHPIPSPCVRSCCLDDTDICMGCGRALAEITGWQALSDDEKRQVIVKAENRLTKSNRNSL